MPAQDLAVQRMERPLQMRRPGECQFLRRTQTLEIVLRAVEMRFVGVSVPACAGIARHLDLFERLLGRLDRRLLIVRVDQQIEIRRHVLALLGQHVEDMRIHPVIGILHGLAPERFAFARQFARLAFVLVQSGEVHDQVAEKVQHAARIFLAETAQRAERAARIERENRLQMRRILFGGVELLRAEAGNADHADVAVTPRLLRNPFDQVVAVPLAASAAVGFEDSARRPDDVDIAARDEELGVARLQEARPTARTTPAAGGSEAATSGPCRSLL